MAHRRYLTEEIADALRVAPSVIGAARLLGMSQGALRKRVGVDRDELARLYELCRARGMQRCGRPIRGLVEKGGR